MYKLCTETVHNLYISVDNSKRYPRLYSFAICISKKINIFKKFKYNYKNRL